MAGEPEHPITTPKGAGAMSVLLTAISLFAPFLFNLTGALVLGALGVIVIAWIYWEEMRVAFDQRQWNPHLKVPLASVALIVAIGFLSSWNATRATSRITAQVPTPAPAIDATELAQRVAGILRREPDQPAAPKPVVVYREPQYEEAQPPAPAPPDKRRAQDEAFSTKEFEEKIEAMRQRSRQQMAAIESQAACSRKKMKVTSELYGLVSRASQAQTQFAYDRKGADIKLSYDAWVKDVEGFFADHKEDLPDISSFEEAKPKKRLPTFLLIDNSGWKVWDRFDAKNNALYEIYKKAVELPCKPEEGSASPPVAAQ